MTVMVPRVAVEFDYIDTVPLRQPIADSGAWWDVSAYLRDDVGVGGIRVTRGRKNQIIGHMDPGTAQFTLDNRAGDWNYLTSTKAWASTLRPEMRWRVMAEYPWYPQSSVAPDDGLLVNGQLWRVKSGGATGTTALSSASTPYLAPRASQYARVSWTSTAAGVIEEITQHTIAAGNKVNCSVRVRGSNVQGLNLNVQFYTDAGGTTANGAPVSTGASVVCRVPSGWVRLGGTCTAPAGSNSYRINIAGSSVSGQSTDVTALVIHSDVTSTVNQYTSLFTGHCDSMPVRGDDAFDSWVDFSCTDALKTLGLKKLTTQGLGQRSVADGATTSGSATLTSATAQFTTNDVGKKVSIPNVAAGTTISAYTNATTVTMSANASATASAQVLVIYNTNNPYVDTVLAQAPTRFWPLNDQTYRTITDATWVSNSNPTVTSPSGAFSADDIGMNLKGTGNAGASLSIATITSASVVTTTGSQSVFGTAASPGTFTVGPKLPKDLITRKTLGFQNATGDPMGSTQGPFPTSPDTCLNAGNSNCLWSFVQNEITANTITTGKFSITGWFKNDSGKDGILWSLGDNAATHIMAVWSVNDSLCITTPNQDFIKQRWHNNILSDGGWHHVAIVWDGSTGLLTAYLDGVAGSTNGPSGYNFGLNTAYFVIGGLNNASAAILNSWQGQAADVGVWNGTALTSGNITAQFNAGNKFRRATFDQRVADVLNAVGIDTNEDFSQVYGTSSYYAKRATSLVGVSALQHIQDCEASEFATFWVDPSGNHSYMPRNTNLAQPVYFTAGSGGGTEHPWVSIVPSDDDQQLYNEVLISSLGNGVPYIVNDPTSEASYLARSYTHTSIEASDYGQIQTAINILTNFKDHHQRISSYKMQVNNEAYMVHQLNADLAQVVTVKWRPPGVAFGSPIVVNYQIIGVDWEVHRGEVFVTHSLRPVLV